jgi:hypothetical protein
MDPERFVFLDETGATTAMTRRYGWGARGERLVDAAPAGHWKTTTLVAGLRSTGIIAPLVLDGPMTGEWFRAYVEQMLAPALQPGDVVVLDNLPAHKAGGVETAIRRTGASLLYLPAYSPRLCEKVVICYASALPQEAFGWGVLLRAGIAAKQPFFPSASTTT